MVDTIWLPIKMFNYVHKIMFLENGGKVQHNCLFLNKALSFKYKP